MSSSKKDPSAPGNVKPPGADEESDFSGYNAAFSSPNIFFPNSECHSFSLLHCRRDVKEFMWFADRCFFWMSTAFVGLTIYNTVEIYRYRSWRSKHMENISEY